MILLQSFPYICAFSTSWKKHRHVFLCLFFQKTTPLLGNSYFQWFAVALSMVHYWYQFAKIASSQQRILNPDWWNSETYFTISSLPWHWPLSYSSIALLAFFNILIFVSIFLAFYRWSVLATLAVHGICNIHLKPHVCCLQALFHLFFHICVLTVMQQKCFHI